MASPSPHPSPSPQDSLFASSRRTSAHADVPTDRPGDPGSLRIVVASPDPHHEPNETDLKRNRDKFEVELEFIQCLASPNYLHELAIQGYLDDPSFLGFLEYLEYWRAPEYAQYIVYPTCLKHLSLLQYPMFRLYMKDVATVDELHNQEIWHWATWREGDNTRLKREQHTRDEVERQLEEGKEAERVRGEEQGELEGEPRKEG